MTSWMGVVLSAAVLLLGAGRAAAQEEIIFSLDWVIHGRHAAYFTALDKGFYKDEGLAVTIVRGYGSTDAINRVATKQSTIAFGDAASLVIARTKGAKVKLVAMVYGKAPYIVYTLTKSGIKEPKDLEGRTIAAPAGDAIRAMFPAFGKVAGFDPGKVRWLSVDPGTKDALLLAGRTDAITEFVMHTPLIDAEAAKQGLTVHKMLLADYGLPVYSNGLLVRDEYLQEKPEVVRKFVRATLRGLQYAFERPDEATDILLKRYPTLDRRVARQEIDIVRSLAETPEAKERGLGYIDAARMQKTIDFVADVFKLETKPTAAEMYTTEYLTRL